MADLGAQRVSEGASPQRADCVSRSEGLVWATYLQGLGSQTDETTTQGGTSFCWGAERRNAPLVQAVRPSALGRGQVTKIGFSRCLLASHRILFLPWLRAKLAAAGPFSVGGQETGMHLWCRPPGRVPWARHQSICEMACNPPFSHSLAARSRFYSTAPWAPSSGATCPSIKTTFLPNLGGRG